MRVVFEKSVLEKITEIRRDADVIGKKISRIELTNDEFNELLGEITPQFGYFCSYPLSVFSDNTKRWVRFDDLLVVEEKV